MDSQRRRRRCHSRPTPPCRIYCPPQNSKPWCFLSSLYSLVVMGSLMAIIYMMLEYHCSTCAAKCNMSNLSKSLDDIARNILVLKQNYEDLELQITRFSQELPRVDGQLEVLEAIAKSLGNSECGFNPKSHISLPNVDVYHSVSEAGKNISRKCIKCPCQPQVIAVN